MIDSPAAVGRALEQRVRERFGPGRATYVPPDARERDAFRALVTEVAAAVRSHDSVRLDAAARAAEPLGYELARWDEAFVLREQDPGRGRGDVFLHANPDRPVVLEAPHPAADEGTAEIALQAFDELGAEALIVAGAHRSNRTEPSPDFPRHTVSDMSHTRETFFQAAHQALTHEGSVVVQVHGYSSARHPQLPAGCQAVLSDGADDHHLSPALAAFEASLDSQGVPALLVTFDDPRLASATEEPGRRLAARTNVQRRDMDARGLTWPGGTAEFVHVELSEAPRAADRRAGTAHAVALAVREAISGGVQDGARP